MWYGEVSGTPTFEIAMALRVEAAPWVEKQPGLEERRIVYKGLTFFQYRDFCQDCQDLGPEYYMVADAVWLEAGLDEGFCCLDCLTNRLGRSLTAADFPQVQVNRLVLYGLKLQQNS